MIMDYDNSATTRKIIDCANSNICHKLKISIFSNFTAASWRIISLIHIYDLDIKLLSELFGPKCRSIQRWYSRFLKTGSIDEKKVPQVMKSRWERHILADVQKYVNAHPTFYIEELQIYLKLKYPYLKNVSESTICRALNFDLQLTRKKLTKAARESVPHEIDIYYEKLLPIYSYPEQLLFIDETSKD